jgi:hypothetical protein
LFLAGETYEKFFSFDMRKKRYFNRDIIKNIAGFASNFAKKLKIEFS